jgi:chloramphenicol-sensitive protein RarD
VTRASRGLLFGALAYSLWGLFPLFWPLLEPATPLEILACRVLSTLLVIVVVLAVTRGWGGVGRMDRPTVLRLCLAGLMIGVNWGGYIWGVNNGHVVETSLGYFINPLITICLGVVLLQERLRPVQWAAVALGGIAVLVLSVDLGRPPWLALLLASSFGMYGLLKKQTHASAPEGLFVEGAVLSLPAAAVLVALAIAGTTTLAGPSATTGHLLLLASGGLVTAVPLLFFAGAATRLPLSTIGLLQYLTPSLQLAIGVLVRGEPLPPARLAGFAVVWLALAVLTADALRNRGQLPDVVGQPEVADVAAAAPGRR